MCVCVWTCTQSYPLHVILTVSAYTTSFSPAAEEEDLARAMGLAQPHAAGQQGSWQGCKSKWGTVAGVSLHNTPIYVLEPKVCVCVCVCVCVHAHLRVHYAV